jgi:hypothetical protein
MLYWIMTSLKNLANFKFHLFFSSFDVGTLDLASKSPLNNFLVFLLELVQIQVLIFLLILKVLDVTNIDM